MRPVVVAYDASWPDMYTEIAAALTVSLGAAGAVLHHVGSTSIPGCDAKDRIDVLACVPHDTPADRVIGPMVDAGFTYEPGFASFMPERWLFHRDEPHAVNVHVERTGLPGSVRDSRLVFRDALRADDNLRDEYVALKHRLAARHPDIDSYSVAKSAFVFGVLATAVASGERIGVHVRGESPDTAHAMAIVARYAEHLLEVSSGECDITTSPPAPPASFEYPMGTFLMLYDDTTPIGCGAVCVIEPGVGELRRMFVVPEYRGRGLGRRMLRALETAAIALGCGTARLDSMRILSAATGMYRSQGYREIADYNANPNATIWMERRLSG